MISDVAMTIETNSSSAADNTFTLAPGSPITWITGDPTFVDSNGDDVTNITSIFVTNTTAGTLQICALVDPT